MWIPVGLGTLAGFGLWCLLRAFIRPVVPLDRALAVLDRPRPTAGAGAGADGRSDLDSVAERIGAWIMTVTGSELRSLSTELAVLERSEEVHLVERIKTGAFYALVPVLVWFIGWSFSTSFAPPVAYPLAMVVGAVAGWFVTDAQVRARATARRREFDAALVTYLSLVSILLSGGAGVQEALRVAVDSGRGWPFLVLRRALNDARLRGLSPWTALGDHGRRLGLDRLVDLAATMELAGTSGAQVRDSLVTKAAALRTHELARIEREAGNRTTAMVGPTGLMLTGFVILVIYPAFQAVLDL